MFNPVLTIADVLDVSNSWQDGIVVTHDNAEQVNEVHFLDITFKSWPTRSFSTYRKPKCTYPYTPFDSCHPTAVKRSIVITELVRLLRTNSTKEAFEYHADFFFGKVRKRGFPWCLLTQCYNTYNWHNRHLVLQRQMSTAPRRKVVPFKITYFSDAENMHLAGMLQRHIDKMCNRIGDRIAIVCCFLSNSNLFRQRYKRFSPFTC